MRRVLAVVMLGFAGCGGADRNPVVPDPAAPLIAPIRQPAETPTPSPAPRPSREDRPPRGGQRTLAGR